MLPTTVEAMVTIDEDGCTQIVSARRATIQPGVSENDIYEQGSEVDFEEIDRLARKAFGREEPA